MVQTGNPNVLYHYHTITNIPMSLGYDLFCTSCMKGYNRDSVHDCEKRCGLCKNTGCKDLPTAWTTCEHCNARCRNTYCLGEHRKPNVLSNGKLSKAGTICDIYWKCLHCSKTMKRKLVKAHECGKKQCFTCLKNTTSKDHMCYIRASKPKRSRKKFIFFDFETTQDTGIHIVNRVVAQKACETCIDDEDGMICTTCGSRCRACNRRGKFGKGYICKPCNKSCGSRQVEFGGENTLHEFCLWLFTHEHVNYTVITHNLKGFDGIFIFQWLMQKGYDVKFLMNGSKLIHMLVKNNLNIQFLDSCNFIPSPLKSFSQTFDIPVIKGYFPHLFNKQDNQDYKGKWPDAKYYDPDGMSTDERRKLLTWHAAKTDETFNLNAEISKYCQDDVSLLRKGCLRFRKLLLELTDDKIDPFNQVTIASTCMTLFKTLFLDEHFVTADGNKVSLRGRQNNDENIRFESSPIAKVPPAGYRAQYRYSAEAVAWLEMRAQFDGVKIQHALNGGEFKIPTTNYSADGYDVANNVIYEYYDCACHGCIKCFPDDMQRMPGRNTMRQVLMDTLKKEECIKRLGYDLITIWSHEINDLPNKKRQFLKAVDVQQPLKPRAAWWTNQLYETTRIGCRAQ